MAKALAEKALVLKPAGPTREPIQETLQTLVKRVAGDALRRADTYPEDTLVPGGGE